MIDLSFLKGKSIAVMGLGASGLAAARALIKGGVSVLAWDDNAEARRYARDSEIPLSDLNTADFDAIDALVLAPGIPHTHPAAHPVAACAKAAGTEIIGDIELLRRADPDRPLIAITGTNGKSTTTALLGDIIEADQPVLLGGNLGPPVLAFSPPANDGAVFVLEVSSYQMELSPSLRPDIAVLLNITPDHLERHGGMDGYIAAKRRIFAQQPHTGVIGVDDTICTRIAADLEAAGGTAVIRVSVTQALDEGVFVRDGILIDALGDTPEAVADLREARALPGAHNWQNAAAAYAAARAHGLSRATIAGKLLAFDGLPHRQQDLGDIAGVRFVNDSKATNAEAAARALTCYEDIYWIAGGRPKESGLSGIEPALPRIRQAFLIGEAQRPFATWLQGHGVGARRCSTLPAATRAAFETARAARDSGDAATPVVLLSPACASFDQFPNFAARGEAFREEVHEMRELEGRR